MRAAWVIRLRPRTLPSLSTAASFKPLRGKGLHGMSSWVACGYPGVVLRRHDQMHAINIRAHRSRVSEIRFFPNAADIKHDCLQSCFGLRISCRLVAVAARGAP